MPKYTEDQIELVRQMTYEVPRSHWREQVKRFHSQFGILLTQGQLKYIRMHYVFNHREKRAKQKRKMSARTEDTETEDPENDDDEDGEYDEDDVDEEAGYNSMLPAGAGTQSANPGSEHLYKAPHLPYIPASQLPLPAVDHGLGYQPGHRLARPDHPAASGPYINPNWYSGPANWSPLGVPVNGNQAPYMPSETGYSDSASYPDAQPMLGAGLGQGVAAPHPLVSPGLDLGLGTGDAGFASGGPATEDIPVDPRIIYEARVNICEAQGNREQAPEADSSIEDEIIREMFEMSGEEE